VIPGSDEERWPNEPNDPAMAAEPNEHDSLEDLGPDIPEVDVPEPPDPTVPSDVARSFWKLVAIFNLALFAVSLGPMLVFFRGEVVTGGSVFFLGAGFFTYGYLRYRHEKRTMERKR
jgi:hypothetical protein